MKTVRRLYFYAIAFISFEVVLWGLVGLIRSIVNPDLITNSAQALATALSLILVGVPIFLIHWLWAQRISARETEEKTATLRAVFLYGALFATLLPAVQNLLALINRIFLGAAEISYERALFGGTQSWPDNLIAIVLNLLLAAYFWSVLRAEWPSLPDRENFSDIRRIYRYLWMLYGLLMIVFGTQQILRYILYVPTDLIGSGGRETFVNATALLVIGAPIWFFAWRILQDALSDPAENSSVLRLVILYLLALGGIITLLTAGGNLAYILLSLLLGESMSAAKFVQSISGPLSIAITFGVLWAYYGSWLNKQFASEENLPRRAGMRRIYCYILAAIGLTTAFIGTTNLFSLILDVLVKYADTIAGETFTTRLASALAVIAVGLPLWILTWRPMQREALADGEMGGHARRSIVRKAYLYLALFASVLGTMGAAAAIVFQLIKAALTGETESFFLSTLLDILQLLILFAVVLVYHLSALRRDGAAQANVLEARQAEFDVLIFDTPDGKFGEALSAAFASQAPNIPLKVVRASEKDTSRLKAAAMILPGSLAFNTPENITTWIRSFKGSRLIVPDEAAGVFWMNDLEQAVHSARALAEGQELRAQSTKKTIPAWTTVAYVFAGLFALQLVFILLALGVSMVTSF